MLNALVGAVIVGIGYSLVLKSGYSSQRVMSALGAAENQDSVEVYSTRGCKFCRKSKATLHDIGLGGFKNIDLDDVAPIVDTDLDERTRKRVRHALMRSVPQIYVANEHVGGCDALLKEIESKEFYDRLHRAGIERDMSKLSASSSQEEDGGATSKALDLSLGVDGLRILNGGEEEISSQEEDALQLSRDLQKSALTLLDDYSTSDGSRVKYRKMVVSAQFHEFVKLSGRFRKIPLDDLAALTSNQRFSMFTNIYNALIIHATCVLGAPDNSPQARSEFFSGASGAAYEISGLRFSADDIEHGILRANCRHPYATPEGQTTFLSEGDPRAALRVAKLDPRVHFVLNCGAKSCPPIKILPDDPEAALRAGARAYLMDNVNVTEMDEFSAVVTLPKLLFWYRADFGDSDGDIINCVVKILTEEVNESDWSTLAKTLADLVGENYKREVTVRYADYDWGSNEDET